MRQYRALLVAACLSLPLLASGTQAQTETQPGADPVQFHPANFVVPPAVHDGDPGDGRCSDPTQPCLNNTDDLLSGRSHILHSDDLALTNHSTNDFTATLTLLKTANPVPTPETPTTLTNVPTLPNSVVIGARMFGSTTDVTVTLVNGDFGFVWRVDDLSGEFASGSTDLTDDRTFALFTMATDLTGDGLDKLVVWTSINTNGTPSGVGVVATVVDPKNPASGPIDWPLP